ncbi:Adenylylsulfate kinase [gamma proteobacterium HdN1]|nr:Adenylylsulfate kinase [gamma proteobacterium HdN1]
MTDPNAAPIPKATPKATQVVWHPHNVSHLQRAEQKQQKPCVLWFTGLSAAGKSTLANALEACLFAHGYHSYLLDGDNVRHGLNKDLGFSDQDRIENIRRIGEVAKLFADAGLIVLTAFISPFQADRDMVRALLRDDEFVEIHVAATLSVCEQRDPKGMYKKAREGKIPSFTGISSPYESPENPEIKLDTGVLSVEACVETIFSYLTKNGYLAKPNLAT